MGERSGSAANDNVAEKAIYSTPSLLFYKACTYNKVQTLQSLTTNLLIIFFVL
jgi:hypothetical protein